MEGLGTLSADEEVDVVEAGTSETYTVKERTEELLYFSLSCAKDARMRMEALERRGQQEQPEWYYQADERRIARDSARRHHATMVRMDWPVSRICENLMKWEGVVP